MIQITFLFIFLIIFLKGMIKNSIFILVFLNVAETKIYIKDGDFENYAHGQYEKLNQSWFDKNGEKITIDEELGNNLLKLNLKQVCQKLSLSFHGKFLIKFDSKKQARDNFPLLLKSNEKIQFQVITDDEMYSHKAEIFFEKKSTICFQTQSQYYIDNVTMEPIEYVEEISFQAFESFDDFNRFTLKISLQNYFTQKYWEKYDLKDKIHLKIDNKQYKLDSIKYIVSEINQIQFSVQMESNIKENSSLNFCFENATMNLSGDVLILFNCQRVEGNSLFIPYYSQEQIKNIKNINEVCGSITQQILDTQNTLKSVGISYFIFNLFTFTNIILLFGYIDFKWLLNPYKIITRNMLHTFMQSTDIGFLIQNFFGVKVNIPKIRGIKEKIKSVKNKKEEITQHGFSSNFFQNSWDELVFIGLMLLKLIIVRFIAFIPSRVLRKCCQKIRKMEVVYVLYEIAASSPTIIIPLGYMLGERGQIGSQNILTKINLMILVMVSFFLFIIPFFLFMKELKIIFKKKQKRKKEHFKQLKNLREEFNKKHNLTSQNSMKVFFTKIKSSKSIDKTFVSKSSQNQGFSSRREIYKKQISFRSEKQNKVTQAIQQKQKIHPQSFERVKIQSDKINEKKLSALDSFYQLHYLKVFQYFLIYFIPFLIGIGSKTIFILSTCGFMFVRFILLVYYRQNYERWHFIKQLFNKIIWLLFCSIYLFFWILEEAQFMSTDGQYFLFLNILNLALIFLILIGGVGEIIFVFVDLIIGVFIFIKACSQSSNEVAPQSEEQQIRQSKKRERKKRKKQKEELMKKEEQQKKNKQKEKWKFKIDGKMGEFIEVETFNEYG